MTEGISKETIIKLLSGNHEYKMSKPYINAQRKLLLALLDQCTDLDQWLPIDENTPKDRELLLLNYSSNNVWIGVISPKCFACEAPTHYKLLK